MKKALYFHEAERLYVFQGLSCEEIAGILNISARTLYEWKKQGEWDKKRLDYLKSSQDIAGQIENLLRRAIREADENPTPQNFYAVVQLLNALHKARGIKVVEEETDDERRQKLLEAIEAEFGVK